MKHKPRYATLGDLYAVCVRQGDCLLWVRGRTKKGYGRIKLSAHPTRWEFAHRRAWRLAGRRIPSGHELHHECGVHNCVNVDHLLVLPQAVHRRLHDLTSLSGIRCKRGHNNWGLRANGRRRCLTCNREGNLRRYYASKGA